MKVIDFRVRLRTSQMLKPWDINNPAPHFKQYIDLYHMKPRLAEQSVEAFVDNMNDQGISKAVVCGGTIEDNEHLLEVKNSQFGEKFFYIAGIHPNYGIRKNLTILDKYRENGFLGVNISPYIWGVKANSKVLYPIYAYCEKNGMIAIVHGSLHYNRFQSMWVGDPKYMDEICMDFPELKLVISHAGNGFGVLGLAVAQKHPNIYLEFSALWPKYLPEATLTAVNSYLKNRCLFGTDYPLVDFSHGQNAWFDALKPENRKLFFYENAINCFFGDPI
ncbi:amidohydrolase 2 family protein [Desulfosarcina variabilis str. Montpellier]|uniref:amidohydrolase family protein n=1 Tax=Desulfosarcina variabilis TaxID=2300 RepID=UPI003AFAE497